MADVKQCDECGNIEADRDEFEFWWFTIGTPGSGIESEACCTNCAVKLIRKAEKRRMRIAREVEAEEAS